MASGNSYLDDFVSFCEAVNAEFVFCGNLLAEGLTLSMLSCREGRKGQVYFEMQAEREAAGDGGS